MLYNQNDTNLSFLKLLLCMYSPGWYVSHSHLFASLLIKLDNYELLQQTSNWLFWPHERSREHYYSPLERKYRCSRKYTLLQSTRRLKLSFVTPPIFLWATLASLFFPAHSKCSVKFFSRNNFMLSYEESAVPIMPMQTTYFSEQKGLCFVFAWVLLWQQRGITSDEE